MMNTLYKSLTIAILVISTFISGINVDLVGAQNTAAGPAASQRLADIVSSQYLEFGRLATEDGLSNNNVRDITQDNRGFRWFAAADGLNRYDGAEFKIYRHAPGDPSSMSHDTVWSIYEDRDGVFWIGTGDGRSRRGILYV
jgi:ligand-binding sensor domain-containing protein